MLRCGWPRRLAELPEASGVSWDAAGGGIVGSTLNLYSRPMPREKRRSVQTHPAILRPEGLDPLGYIAIVNVAAVDFEEIAERGRIIARALERGGEFVVECSAGLLVQAG